MVGFTMLADVNQLEIFPYSYQKDSDKIFYVQRLGITVQLTPDVTYERGIVTYYVRQWGTENNRVFPVRAYELLDHDSQEAKEFPLSEDRNFPVNTANFDQLISFFVGYVESNPFYTRDAEMLKKLIAKIKNPRSGLIKLLELERNKGYFLDKLSFIDRMSSRDSSFNWNGVVDLLDFVCPRT